MKELKTVEEFAELLWDAVKVPTAGYKVWRGTYSDGGTCVVSGRTKTEAKKAMSYAVSIEEIGVVSDNGTWIVSDRSPM